jgi:hypothetical protein
LRYAQNLIQQNPEVAQSTNSSWITSALALLGIDLTDQKGATKLPETRLQSAGDARKLLWALMQEDSPRSLQRALVKGLVDGHPPYDDERRKNEGRGWECNLNFMEGQAIMNRTAVPYYNLFARAFPLVECRTAYQPNHPKYEDWNKSISLRFHNLLKRWREFNWNIQQVSYWMRLHGIGFANAENDHDWRFRSLETGSVLAPKGSPSCLDGRVPFLIVRIPYRIVELWNYIKNEDAAKKAGWNVEAVKLAIKYGMKGSIASSDWYAQPWEHYERILKNNDLTASFTDGDLVNCAIILVEEFSKPGQYTGKISKFIFTEFKTVGVDEFKKMPKGGEEEKDFLFSDPNCYDDYAECMIPFFRNTGDGTWHSVRGYAMEAFKHLEVDNRLLCQLINRAFIDSSVVMQSPNERERKRMELAVWGSVVRLPAGVELKPTVVQGGTDGVINTHRLLSNHLQSNLGTGAPRSISREDGRGEQPTARHVDYIAANEASISEGEITIFYEQLDSLYTLMFNRVVSYSSSDDEAKRFIKECYEDGVPKEALQDMEFVRANRQNGYGSPEMGMMKMNQGQMLVPMLPEDGKQNWLEDAVTVVYGPDKTNRYAPKQHVPGDQDWEATVENQMIAAGRLPVIASGQDDVIHLQKHFEDAQQTLAPVGQGLNSQNGQKPDPQTLAQSTTYAQTMAQHTQEHIARLEHDPTRKKEAKLFSDQFKQLAEFSSVLWKAMRQAHRQIQIEQQQNDQATALSALDQAKVQSVQTGTQLAAQKVQSQIENQRVKTEQAMRLKDLKTSHDLRINTIQTGHQIGLDRVKTGHEISMDRMRQPPADVTE